MGGLGPSAAVDALGGRMTKEKRLPLHRAWPALWHGSAPASGLVLMLRPTHCASIVVMPAGGGQAPARA
eukprot:10342388-Alexandrium_andersonii.AAC.1